MNVLQRAGVEGALYFSVPLVIAGLYWLLGTYNDSVSRKARLRRRVARIERSMRV